MKILPLLLLCSCVSAGGMLKVQAKLWKDGGVAHLAATRPALPGDDATAEQLRTYGDWARAVVVASSTICAEDKNDRAACECADTAATSAIDCDAFLGAP